MKESLEALVVSVKTDARYTEAVVTLRDASLLCFRHRVGERWAKAIELGDTADGSISEGEKVASGVDDDALGRDGAAKNHAAEILDAIHMFRLNAKHLEVEFCDGSTWEWTPGGPTPADC